MDTGVSSLTICRQRESHWQFGQHSSRSSRDRGGSMESRVFQVYSFPGSMLYLPLTNTSKMEGRSEVQDHPFLLEHRWQISSQIFTICREVSAFSLSSATIFFIPATKSGLYPDPRKVCRQRMWWGRRRRVLKSVPLLSLHQAEKHDSMTAKVTGNNGLLPSEICIDHLLAPEDLYWKYFWFYRLSTKIQIDG